MKINDIKCSNCKNYYKQIPSDYGGVCQKKYFLPMCYKPVTDNDFCYDDFEGKTEELQYEKDYKKALDKL